MLNNHKIVKFFIMQILFLVFAMTSINAAGSITIINDTSVDSTQAFTFTASGGMFTAPDNVFSLVDNAGGASAQKLFADLYPDTYTFTETLPAGDWSLIQRSCTAAGGGMTSTIANNGANGLDVTLASDEDVTCVFTNEFKNTDATLTASSIIKEPVNLPSTADTTGEAVNLFDFTISDGGGGDGLSTDVSQIVLHTSGTADFSKVTWRLNGANVSKVVGVYDDFSEIVTFSGLTISIADGEEETYTLSGYYSTPTGLTDNETYIFSVDGASFTNSKNQ